MDRRLDQRGREPDQDDQRQSHTSGHGRQECWRAQHQCGAGDEFTQHQRCDQLGDARDVFPLIRRVTGRPHGGKQGVMDELDGQDESDQSPGQRGVNDEEHEVSVPPEVKTDGQIEPAHLEQGGWGAPHPGDRTPLTF